MDPTTNGQSIGALAAPWAAAALALVPTGLAKVRDPLPAVRAMRAVGVPSRPLAVRAIGVAEVASGAGALAVGGALASGAVAVLYLAFAAFLVRALRAPERPDSCGCLGTVDLEPNWLHAVLVLAGAAVAASAAAARTAGLPAMFVRYPFVVSGIVAAAVAIVYASFLVVSELPGAISAYRAPREDTRDPARPAPAPRFELGMR